MHTVVCIFLSLYVKHLGFEYTKNTITAILKHRKKHKSGSQRHWSCRPSGNYEAIRWLSGARPQCIYSIRVNNVQCVFLCTYFFARFLVGFGKQPHMYIGGTRRAVNVDTVGRHDFDLNLRSFKVKKKIVKKIVCDVTQAQIHKQEKSHELT